MIGRRVVGLVLMSRWCMDEVCDCCTVDVVDVWLVRH